MENTQLSNRDFLLYEVDVQLNMLLVMVMNMIHHHVNTTDIVIEDDGGGHQWLVEFLEELNPTSFLQQRGRQRGTPLPR